MKRPLAGVIACTAAYGALKLYWALGGSIGLRQAPLPAEAIQAALAREPSAVIGHWASVGLAAVGIGVALLLTRPAPGRLWRWGAGALGVLMILRAVLQAIGDGQRLLAGVSPGAAATALWDLTLWSPFFLLWGVCWVLIAPGCSRASGLRRLARR
jgi:hypothetical protein